MYLPFCAKSELQRESWLVWTCCSLVSDALVAMEKAMKRDKIIVNDRQLACARIASAEGQDYLKGMAAAGNYAWVNRSSMTFLTRQVHLKLLFWPK